MKIDNFLLNLAVLKIWEVCERKLLMDWVVVCRGLTSSVGKTREINWSWEFFSSLLVGKARRNFKCNFHVKSFIRFVLASVCSWECVCLFSHWKIIIQSEREPNFWRYDQKFFFLLLLLLVQREKCEYKRRDGNNRLMQSDSQPLIQHVSRKQRLVLCVHNPVNP